MYLDLETRVKFESTTQNYTKVSEMNKDGAQLNYFLSRKKSLARRGSCQEEEPRKGGQPKKVNVGSGSIGRAQMGRESF